MKVTRTKKKSSLVQEISKALDMSPISFPMRFQTRFLITRNMWRKRTENTQTLFSKVFFDCTNYYFEIDLPKEDKQKGPSKENKHEPIIGQALLLYVDLVPLACRCILEICQRNHMDIQQTLKKNQEELLNKMNLRNNSLSLRKICLT